jgi:hypothetical protein
MVYAICADAKLRLVMLSEDAPLSGNQLAEMLEQGTVPVAKASAEWQHHEKAPSSHDRAEQSMAEQSRAEQSRAEQSRAEQSRAEQSRAEQSRAEQSRAEHALLCAAAALRRGLVRRVAGGGSAARRSGDPPLRPPLSRCTNATQRHMPP